MKKVFFELLRVFSAANCRIFQPSGRNYFSPEGEAWASFTHDEMFGLTDRPSNPKYNGLKPIVYGNLKERELLQLEQLFRQAASKEERQNYKNWLLSAANRVRWYWHQNFEVNTSEYKISQLEQSLRERDEYINELEERLQLAYKEIRDLDLGRYCEEEE